MENKEFNYTYSSLSQAEKKQVENIKRQYGAASQKDGDLEELLRLDKKVKTAPKAIATIVGVVGALVLGTGMSVVMVWQNMVAGVIIGIAGVVICLATPLLYKAVFHKLKNKYSNQIIELSERLLGEESNDVEQRRNVEE
ncbi:MAG: hypothetical protein ACI4MY_07330 [Christensenellales bacterium]